MADIVNLVNTLASTIGGDIKSLTTQQNDTIATLTAIRNALDNTVNAATVQSMIDTAIASIASGNPDETVLNNILIALDKRVRIDTPQQLSQAEMAQARSNIGAASATDLGNVANADFVATYQAAKA